MSRAHQLTESLSLLLVEKRGKVVSVPSFRNRKAAIAFMKTLGPDDRPADSVIDPESGDVLMLSSETRRKMLKKEFKSRDIASLFDAPFLMSPFKGTWDDEKEFYNFYRVVWKSASKLGYDSKVKVATIVKRKDSKPFGTDDVVNIGYFRAFLNKSSLAGTGIVLAGKPIVGQKVVNLHVK